MKKVILLLLASFNISSAEVGKSVFIKIADGIEYNGNKVKIDGLEIAKIEFQDQNKSIFGKSKPHYRYRYDVYFADDNWGVSFYEYYNNKKEFSFYASQKLDLNEAKAKELYKKVKQIHFIFKDHFVSGIK
jgi:hypothetical protein